MYTQIFEGMYCRKLFA